MNIKYNLIGRACVKLYRFITYRRNRKKIFYELNVGDVIWESDMYGVTAHYVDGVMLIKYHRCLNYRFINEYNEKYYWISIPYNDMYNTAFYRFSTNYEDAYKIYMRLLGEQVRKANFIFRKKFLNNGGQCSYNIEFIDYV